MWAAMVTVLIGLWIMVSPELTVFERSAAINHFIAGPLAITIGVMLMILDMLGLGRRSESRASNPV